jgi:hypothetical protein
MRRTHPPGDGESQGERGHRPRRTVSWGSVPRVGGWSALGVALGGSQTSFWTLGDMGPGADALHVAALLDGAVRATGFGTRPHSSPVPTVVLPSCGNGGCGSPSVPWSWPARSAASGIASGEVVPSREARWPYSHRVCASQTRISRTNSTQPTDNSRNRWPRRRLVATRWAITSSEKCRAAQ